MKKRRTDPAEPTRLPDGRVYVPRFGPSYRKPAPSGFDRRILDAAHWLSDRANNWVRDAEVRATYTQLEHDAVVDLEIAHTRLRRALDADDHTAALAALVGMLEAERRRLRTQKSTVAKLPRGGYAELHERSLASYDAQVAAIPAGARDRERLMRDIKSDVIQEYSLVRRTFNRWLASRT